MRSEVRAGAIALGLMAGTVRVIECTALDDGTVRWGATVTVSGETVLVGQTQPRGTVSNISTDVGTVRAEIDATSGECAIDLLPEKNAPSA